ncbi:MAG: hypothetical protein WC784_03770 [Candidatus Shapirobacteria bacterium]|jgi:hypothetical protein
MFEKESGLNKNFRLLNEVVKPIPTDKKKGWDVVVTDSNGVSYPIQDFSMIELVNAQKGIVLDLGQVENIYDAPTTREIDGGGDVIIPAIVINDIVHVGLSRVQRKGNFGWEFPRVMLEPGITSLELAQAEAANMCEKITCDVSELNGRWNANNAYMLTQHSYEEKDGATFFLLKVQPGSINRDKDGTHFIFRETKSASPTAKKVLTCEFFSLDQVDELIIQGEIYDMYVLAALHIAKKELTKENLPVLNQF